MYSTRPRNHPTGFLTKDRTDWVLRRHPLPVSNLHPRRLLFSRVTEHCHGLLNIIESSTVVSGIRSLSWVDAQEESSLSLLTLYSRYKTETPSDGLLHERQSRPRDYLIRTGPTDPNVCFFLLSHRRTSRSLGRHEVCLWSLLFSDVRGLFVFYFVSFGEINPLMYVFVVLLNRSNFKNLRET